MNPIAAGVFAVLGIVAALLLPSVILVAVIVFYARKARQRRQEREVFLCDSCKYNTPVYCSLPARPFARVCDTYRAQVDPDEVALDGPDLGR